MHMSPKALRVFDEFLNKVERQPDRKKAIWKTVEGEIQFDGPDDRAEFMETLVSVRAEGAIVFTLNRVLPNVVERIKLVDPAPLYGILHREPLGSRVTKAKGLLLSALPSASREILELIDTIEADWSAAKQSYGLEVGSPDVIGFLRALDAVLRRSPADQSELRHYSRTTTGYSKLIEHHASRIARWLRATGRVPSDLDDWDTLKELGLEKFPQPLLIAGPITVGGMDIGYLPYLGLPPEAYGMLKPNRAVRSILTIENLASFNRHVREARLPDDVVVFTGGYPSRRVRDALRIVFSWRPEACFHWGDLDPWGVSIARHIASATGVDLRPHLMDASLLQVDGVPPPPAGSAEDGFAALTHAMAASGVHVEQEAIDPMPVMP